MFPGEWFDFHFNQEGVFTPQWSNDLWVYDPSRNDDGAKLEEYLRLFYENQFQAGYAVGLSPLGLFDVHHTEILTGIVFGRALLLDFESPSEEIGETLGELRIRLGVSNLSGFVAKSSLTGTHFYNHAYQINNLQGKVNLAREIGSALLLNREGSPQKYDDRSGGHALRSLTEQLYDYHNPVRGNSEISCLRDTISLLKPSQPTHLFDT